MKKEITKDQIRLACYEILGTRRSEEDRNKIVKLENFSIFGERRLKEDLLDNLKKKLVFVLNAFPEVNYDFLYDDICYHAYNLRIIDYNNADKRYYSIIIEAAEYKENYKEQLRIIHDYSNGYSDEDVTYRFVKGYLAQKEEGEGYDFVEEKIIGEWTEIEGRMSTCCLPGDRYFNLKLEYLISLMTEGFVKKVWEYYIKGLADLGDRRPWSIYKDDKCIYNFPWMLSSDGWPYNIHKFNMMEYLRQVIIPNPNIPESLKKSIRDAKSICGPDVVIRPYNKIAKELWNAPDRKVIFSSFWNDGITTQRHYRKDGVSSFYYNNGKQKEESYSDREKTFEDYYPKFSEYDLLDLLNDNPANDYIKILTGGFVYSIGYNRSIKIEIDKDDFENFVNSGKIKYAKREDGSLSNRIPQEYAEEITKFWYDYLGKDQFTYLKKRGCFF